MKKHLLLALIVVVMTAAHARSADITFDNPVQVVAQGGGWSMTQTGTIRLAAGETLQTFQFAFVDPNGNALAPNIMFTNPGAGPANAPFTMQLSTATKGNWNSFVQINWTIAGGGKGQLTKTNPFTVGQ